MVRLAIRNLSRSLNAEVSNSSVDRRFLRGLTDYIEHSSKNRKPSKSYKPSSLKCLRQMYYQITGTEVDDSLADAGNVGMAESGTDRHIRLQDAIQAMCEENPDYEWIDVETYVKENNIDYLKIVKKDGNETKCYHTVLNMSFMCDGILKIKGEYYILEIKTENSFKFMKRETVATEHKTQASCYSLAFKIDKVLFLYECRDTLAKKTYVLNVSDAMRQNLVVNKILECDDYVEKLVPPPRSQVKKDCQYCRYLKQCKKDGK